MNSFPLIDRIVSLSELSKNLEGELRPVDAQREKCPRNYGITVTNYRDRTQFT